MRAATCTTAPAVCPSPGPKASDDSATLKLLDQIIAAPNLFAALGLEAKATDVPPLGLLGIRGRRE